MENQNFEKKSLRIISFDPDGKFKPSESDRDYISKHCVAFANANGGTLVIGIEDKQIIPPTSQKIDDLDLPNKLKKRISDITQNVSVNATIETNSNGGQTIKIEILPSRQTIASTNDGKYYLRVSDSSIALLPEELSRLLNDKPSFIWETKKTKVFADKINDEKLRNFISQIKSAEKERVSDFVKKMSDEEILEHYFFTDESYLTNLGILWIGSRQDRGKLSYCPTVTFLKYDEREERIKK